MKIIFAGTPEFAAVALRALHAAGFQIPLVLTQPDRPAGRGLHLQASAVKQFAAAQGIPVAQPVSLRLDGKYPAEAQEAHQLLHRTPHDVMVVAAYGLILPPSVLQMAPLGCLNIHASLLPRWRGAAPIQRAIEAGDAETGITIMQMDAGLDTGPMLRRQAVPITLADTAGSLHDKLASLGASMIVEALQAQARGELRPEPQAQAGVTYAAKVRKEEAALDFALAAEMLAHKIQAFNPFPGATALLDGAPLKLWRAAALPLGTGGAVPGTVLAASAEGIDVACGHGVLRLTELQKAGGKRWSAAQFLQGSVLQGARFG